MKLLIGMLMLSLVSVAQASSVVYPDEVQAIKPGSHISCAYTYRGTNMGFDGEFISIYTNDNCWPPVTEIEFKDTYDSKNNIRTYVNIDNVSVCFVEEK